MSRGLIAQLSQTGLSFSGNLAQEIELLARVNSVLPCTGNGAMQMNGLNGCITVAKYWREWEDPRWITRVLNNRDLNQVTWEQRILDGDPKSQAGQDIPDFPYAGFAESIGLRAIRVDNPEEVGKAWDQALASDRPVILEAIVDPDVRKKQACWPGYWSFTPRSKSNSKCGIWIFLVRGPSWSNARRGKSELSLIGAQGRAGGSTSLSSPSASQGPLVRRRRG